MIRLVECATEAEMQSLRDTLNTPAIALNAGMPPSAQQAAHAIARERHGLPEIPGYYGVDLKAGNFLAGESAREALRAAGVAIDETTR